MHHDDLPYFQKPEVMTADTGKVYGFPQECLVESWGSAKHAAIKNLPLTIGFACLFSGLGMGTLSDNNIQQAEVANYPF